MRSLVGAPPPWPGPPRAGVTTPGETLAEREAAAVQRQNGNKPTRPVLPKDCDRHCPLPPGWPGEEVGDSAR